MVSCPTCQAELADDATFCVSCGNKVVTQAGPYGAPSPDGRLGVGQVVDGKYRVERVLGEGGMGVVYLARSVHTDVEVVIKAVLPEIAHRADIRQRTLDEGKALARIDHPNVVQLKSVVADEHQLLLVMQFIDGEDLEKRILRYAKMGQPMPLAEALGIFQMVLAGVAAAHAEGVIHRDLKPANILIRAKDGVAKVTDFGIAKPLADAEEGKGNTKGVIGSVHFMSPEQVKGQKDLDRRADVYALGIVLFQMLTGRVPFDADNTFDTMRQQIEEPLPSITPTRPDLPPALDGILQQACAKDRDHRFASCEAFLEAVKGLGAGHVPAPTAGQVAPGPTIPQAPADAMAQATAPTLAHTPVPGGPSGPGVQAATYPSGPQPPIHPSGAHPQGAYGPPPGGPGTITSQPATYASPPQGGGRNWLLPVLGGGAALALIVGIGVAAGIGSPSSETGSGETDEIIDVSPPSTATAEATSDPEPEDPLAAFAGRWISESGREMDAVVVGSRLEFQVVDPMQFGAQGYQVGEARFVLRPVPDEDGTFTVEDRIRPVPPAGFSYDNANARTTCLAIWREASGSPLRAEATEDRLDVDFAKIEPKAKNFALSGKTVVSCKGLEKLKGTRVPSVLRRP